MRESDPGIAKAPKERFVTVFHLAQLGLAAAGFAHVGKEIWSHIKTNSWTKRSHAPEKQATSSQLTQMSSGQQGIIIKAPAEEDNFMIQPSTGSLPEAGSLTMESPASQPSEAGK